MLKRVVAAAVVMSVVSLYAADTPDLQAAVVMATFVWGAANRPEMLPRKPLSKEDLTVPGLTPGARVAPRATRADDGSPARPIRP